MSSDEQTQDFWADALQGSDGILTNAQFRNVALGTLAARRALDTALPPELIPDPVLDILLALFTLVDPGQRVANALLETATTVSQSVVQRYLQALANYGFVTYDAAADVSALTPIGVQRVRSALLAIVRSQIVVNDRLAAETSAS